MKTNMRKTSLDAYDEIRDDLGKRQKMVFDALLKLGEATDLQVSNHLNVPINTVTPRRGELFHKGLIEEARIIQQNGRSATSWKVCELDDGIADIDVSEELELMSKPVDKIQMHEGMKQYKLF